MSARAVSRHLSFHARRKPRPDGPAWPGECFRHLDCVVPSEPFGEQTDAGGRSRRASTPLTNHACGFSGASCGRSPVQHSEHVVRCGESNRAARRGPAGLTAVALLRLAPSLGFAADTWLCVLGYVREALEPAADAAEEASRLLRFLRMERGVVPARD